MKTLVFLTLLVIASIIPDMRADVVNSTSSMITISEHHNPRRATDHFYTIGLNGGITKSDDTDLTGGAWLDFGYKKQISTTSFYWGGKLSAGSGFNQDNLYFFDVAPTISYFNKPGSFDDSFEATLGLGLGLRHAYISGFAFTPELNLMYWFNQVGIGAIVRYSFMKSTESYHTYMGWGYIGADTWGSIPYLYTHHIDQNSFYVGARVAIRF